MNQPRSDGDRKSKLPEVVIPQRLTARTYVRQAENVPAIAMYVAVVVLMAAAFGLLRPTAAAMAVDQTDKILLEVVVDQRTVASGDDIQFDVTVTNTSATDLTYGLGHCASPVEVEVGLRATASEASRSWSGIQGQLRRFIAENGKGPGGAPFADPAIAFAKPGECSDDVGTAILVAGASTSMSLRWTAELSPGMPVEPGNATFVATFRYDPIVGPADVRGASGDGPGGIRPIEFSMATASGELEIAARGMDGSMSAGQALDAVLGDDQFVEWLERRSPETWSGANVYLGGSDATPGDKRPPAWTVELFREKGVPRDFAIARVDPNSGRVELDFCNDPCDR